MTIVRAAMSSWTITRQSPTRSRDSGRALEPTQRGAALVLSESVDRREDSLLNLRVEPFEVSVGATFELDRPRLRRHAPCLHMICVGDARRARGAVGLDLGERLLISSGHGLVVLGCVAEGGDQRIITALRDVAQSVVGLLLGRDRRRACAGAPWWSRAPILSAAH